MIIGFTGYLGSGKDTAALRLSKIVDLEYVPISFAAKLKNSAAAALGVTREFLEENKNNREAFVVVTSGVAGVAQMGDHEIDVPNMVNYITIREYLQYYGTESHRDVFGDNFWVDAALPDQEYDPELLHVITDVRFPNELARVQKIGGYVVRIRGASEPTSNHASEQVLKGVDWEIDNKLRGDDFAWLDSQLMHMVRTLFPTAPLYATTSGETEESVGSRIVIMGSERIRT